LRPASSSAAARSFLASSKVRTGFILMLASPSCLNRALSGEALPGEGKAQLQVS
jgi:hypothetical protein